MRITPLPILCGAVVVATGILTADLVTGRTPEASAVALYWKDTDGGIKPFIPGCVAAYEHQACQGAPVLRGPDLCDGTDLSGLTLTEQYVVDGTGNPTAQCILNGQAFVDINCEQACRNQYGASFGVCNSAGGDCLGQSGYPQAFCECFE